MPIYCSNRLRFVRFLNFLVLYIVFADSPPPSLCLNGRAHTRRDRPKEWKEQLRQLIAILAEKEPTPNGEVPVPLDTEMAAEFDRRMVDVKAAALRVVRLVATDHERVAELGRHKGFQVNFVLIS